MDENKGDIKKIIISILIVALIVAAFFIIKSLVYKKSNLITQENQECINYYNKCLCVGVTKELTECYDNDCGQTNYDCRGWEVCWEIDEVVCE